MVLPDLRIHRTNVGTTLSLFAFRASPAGKEGSPVTDGSPDFSATAIVAVDRYFPGSALNFSPQPREQK